MNTDAEKIKVLKETLEHVQKILQRMEESVGSSDACRLMNFLEVSLDREVEIMHKIVNNRWTKEDYSEYNRLTQSYLNSCGMSDLNSIRSEIERLYLK